MGGGAAAVDWQQVVRKPAGASAKD